jgi:hypothetical protein
MSGPLEQYLGRKYAQTLYEQQQHIRRCENRPEQLFGSLSMTGLYNRTMLILKAATSDNSQMAVAV